MNTQTPDLGAHRPVLDGLDSLVPGLTIFYRDLHRHPELSGQERRTASRLAQALAAAGYTVTTGVGGHGVVAVLVNGEGPRVMLRTELDALPLTERTGLPYAPTGDAAHACGHDLHVTAALGAATLLARSRDQWSGTVVVVGQPAEETLTGARAMLEDGLYERFGPPDAVLAQHSSPLLGGMVAHGYGPVLAGGLGLEVTLHGRGGHAGAPHLTVDPVVAAASLVLRLQVIVSRESAPADQVALTVGSLHAGSRSNIVPDHATLGITVRALAPAALHRVHAAVERVVRAESAASGCPRDPDIRVVSRSPVTTPDPGTAAAILAAHRGAFGESRVTVWPPSMATEDFALFGDAGLQIHDCPGISLAYWMIGASSPRQWAATTGTPAERLAALPSNHSPDFAPHPATAIPTGAAALTTAALTVLHSAERPAGPRAGAAGPGTAGRTALSSRPSSAPS